MAVDVERARRLFTIEEYEKMAAMGILTEDDRVELIDGEIVEMSPIGLSHAAVVGNLNNLLMGHLAGRAWIWVQNPVLLPPRSVPQPDLAVLRSRSYRREAASVEDVFLFIEVADTSLRYDRTVKLPLYARAGIPEYWIVDVNTDTLEVYGSPLGNSYEDRRVFAREGSVTLQAFPNAVISLDAIFA